MKEWFQKVLLFLRDHLAPLVYMIIHRVGKRRKQELERKLSNLSLTEEAKLDEGDQHDE